MIFSKLYLGILALQHLSGAINASRLLFRGGTIIGWNEEKQSLEVTRKGSLFVSDDRIVDVYADGEEPAEVVNASDIEIVNATNKILTPGFIDTHRHNWQTLWRTCNGNNTLWDLFYHRYNSAVQGAIQPEDIYNAQLLSIYEGLSVGVTTQLDHAHHAFSKAHAEAGLAASIDSAGSLEERASHFREIAILRRNALDASPATLVLSFDEFQLSRDAVQPLIDLVRDEDIPVLTTHLVGGPYGYKTIRLHDLGILNTSMAVVFSHGSFLGSNSYQLLKSINQYVSICIESEMSYAQSNPTAHLWLDQASVGMDATFLASGDILTQARILLQFIRNRLNTPMTPEQAFLLSTRSGGLALRRPDLGIIAAGAKADILIWGTENLALLGWRDPVAAIILHANPADIQDVLIDGVFKKRDGRLLAPGLDAAKEKFLETVTRAQDVVLTTPSYEFHEGDQHVNGAKLGLLPMVDVTRGHGDGYV
ncbi:amidohydrolase [Corynespora cassiicola Philippines]|uniref:Amidohydrolase n=1 Tax=Corynespora cassiicola Philippines TaxID=1448308 RepID=A0A2T2N1K9_CORCC|nr:amidohydrolase [Corynespora cassiicola Philippines]